MVITSAKMLAHVLREERKKRKISQDEAAQSMGLKQATVSAFENHPEGTKMETLFKLLAALGLELQVIERQTEPYSLAASNPDGQSDKLGWDQEW